MEYEHNPVAEGGGGGGDDEPVEVPLPENDDQDDSEASTPDELSFCELCGSGGEENDELLRCEECGRLHCSHCREYDDEGTPYCTNCYDDLFGA